MRLVLALLLHVVEHALQLGPLLVHLLQPLLGVLLLGLQVLQTAALPVQVILHLLRTHKDKDISEQGRLFGQTRETISVHMDACICPHNWIHLFIPKILAKYTTFKF